MKLIQLYRDILSVGSLIADGEGMVSAAVAGQTVPFMVEGKRLVLPTQEHLSNPDWSNRVTFHPLSENILRGESKVMEKYRHAVNVRMNYVLGCIGENLLDLAQNVDAAKRLNPDQTQFLTKVLGADEKTLDIWKHLLKAMGMGNNDKCIVHLFLKRGGVVRGKKYNRACIVSFPLYEELWKEERHPTTSPALTKEQKQVYGITISKKHKAVLRALIEFMLPGIENANQFDSGSESDIAPFLDALMQGVAKVASSINNVIDEFGEFIHLSNELRYNDDWVEKFENLNALLPEIRMIPMQAGNEGSTSKVQVPTHTGQQQQPQGLTNVAPAPVHAAHPPPGVMAMPGPQQLQQAWGQQVQPAAAPAAGGIAKTASGAIDMSATLRSNPAVAAALVGAYPGMYPGVVMAPPPGPVGARMGDPRWASGPMVMTTGQWPGMMQQPQQFGAPGFGGGMMMGGMAMGGPTGRI